MVSTTHLVALLLTAFIFIVVPGPSVLFTVGRALSIGRRGALLTVLGNTLGVFVQVIAVAVGVGALVESSVLAFTVLKLAGAAYLIYLGVQAVRHRKALGGLLDEHKAAARPHRIISDGFVVGITNPKSIVFLPAVLPQFVDPGLGHVPLQMMIVGAVFPLIALVSDSAWALAAGTARAWFARSPRRLALIGGAGGFVMIGFGLNLAITGRRD
ncbi:MAG: LysE family translocator [Streptosporangiales bacterium]|nr:LysE family translocator [Streptosporangiales bacterium]